MASITLKQVRMSVQGLDCPNCAAKLERALRQVNGVQEVNLDFIAGILHLSISGEETIVLENVRATVAKVEPDVVLKPKSEDASVASVEHDKSNQRPPWTRLAIGGVLYALALVWPGEAPLWVFLPSYLILGGNTVWRALRNIGHGQLFDENFLMALATLGAFAIKSYPEAVAVMLFYEIGELLQDLAVDHSRRSITQLVDIRPDYANLIKENGDLEQVPPVEITPGMCIVVKPGERVPLDGSVVEGISFVDTAALTGESVPRQVRSGDEILAGFVNQTGALTVKTSKSFETSAIARVLKLVEEASSRKAPTERFITRFARYYTPAVVIAATAVAVIPPLLSPVADWNTWIYRALVFLVVSCPCALVVSVPLGFFGGIGGAARQGILVKGANFLEGLYNVHTVVFDKTGTLTKGVFRVVAVNPVTGKSRQQFLAVAAAAESLSLHPIAQSIRLETGNNGPHFDISNYQEIMGEGLVCQVDDLLVALGNNRLMQRYKVTTADEPENGTVIHMAVDGEYQGYLVIADELKDDAQSAVELLRRGGVTRIVMLTGDRHTTAESVAQELGLDEVHAELLPAEKLSILERLNVPNGTLVFVGDGINDAPVLARADVGVAMGALGSDAAIEAADVVLMTDEPSRLATAIRVARRTRTIVWQNIALSFGIKALVLVLGSAGVANLWEAVFADVGVALLAVMNSVRVLKIPKA